MEDKIFKGVVVCYYPQKNYGFVRSNCSDQDIFFHASNVISHGTLPDGSPVAFKKETYLSRAIAFDIEKL